MQTKGPFMFIHSNTEYGICQVKMANSWNLPAPPGPAEEPFPRIRRMLLPESGRDCGKLRPRNAA